jgi:ankyrin repeat protein/cytochrome c-type biogenesis protein CcmH/NrfG
MRITEAHVAIATWLVLFVCTSQSAEPDQPDNPGALVQFARTAAIRAAAKAGNVERVAELLKTNPAWVESPDLEGDVLLHAAANQGNRALAQLLIDKGANVNATNKSSHSPLHLAAMQGRADVAALLLANRAELLRQCANGMTPLHEASGQGHTSVVEILLAQGTPVNTPNRNGDTPLHLAVQKGHLDLARLLIAKRASVNATNKLGETPLHHTAAQGDQAMAKLLLANRADAAKRDAQLKLPLEIASEKSHEDVARVLRLHLAELASLNPDKRLSVAVLPFHDGTGNLEHAHWRYSIPGVLGKSLDEMGSIRVLPRSATRYGFRRLGLKVGDSVTADQARKIGEQIQARRVIWGSYRQVGGKWQVSARVLNVASGKGSRQLSAVSTNWCDLRDQLLALALRELQLVPSAEERARMTRCKTQSQEAVAWYSKGFAAFEEGKPFSEAEACARQALAADPQIEGGREMLAATLFSQGKTAEAEEILRHLLTVEPGNVDAHQMKGVMLLMQNDPSAGKELRVALQLAPENSEGFHRMGELHAAREQWEAALYFWTEAKRLDPTDASARSALARGYAMTRDRTQAVIELKEAERLDPDDPAAAQFVPQVYDILGDIPQAIEHCEKFVALARSRGVNPELTETFAKRAESLKASLTATAIEALMPKEYSASELEQTLRAKLTPAELKLVVNPLASAPEMRQWALELTRDAPDDLARARLLFNELARRIQTAQGWEARTAQQVFALWKKPAENFSCNEFAKLFVALARETGLKAFYVHLEQDFQGRIVYHDCAMLFADGKALLIDPAYRWFGVPHRKFIVLDDVQTIAHQALQPTDDSNVLARQRLGVKLHPDLAWAHLQLARSLVAKEQFEAAGQALAEAQRLEPDRWDWFILLGMSEGMQRHFEIARLRLEEGLKGNPDDGLGHFWMGAVLREQGKGGLAREEYRACLRCLLPPEMEKTAIRELAQLNELLGAE